MTFCSVCKEEKKTQKYADSLLNFSHGLSIDICNKCLIKKYKKQIADMTLAIKVLEKDKNGSL